MDENKYNIAYWKYFFVVMFSLIGNGLFLYTQGWYVLDISGSKLSVGLTWCIFFLPSLFLLPIMGKLLDIKNTKKVLVVLEFAKSFVFLFFAFIFFYKAKIYLIYLMSASIGILFSIFFPSIYVVLKKIIDQKELTKYSHTLEISIQIASIIAVVSTGFLYKKLGFLILMSIAGALTLIGGIILLTIKIDSNTNSNNKLLFLSEYKNFFGTFKKLFKSEDNERKIYIFGIFHQFPQNVILALNIPLLLYVYETMKKGPVEYGILDGLISASAMIAGIYWAKHSTNSLKKRYILLMPIISAIILILMPFINTYGITPYVVFCLLFVFLISSKIQCRAAVISITPAEVMGQLTSFYQTTSYIIMLILAFSLSYLCQNFPVKYTFLIVGIMMFGFTYFLKWIYRD